MLGRSMLIVNELGYEAVQKLQGDGYDDDDDDNQSFSSMHCCENSHVRNILESLSVLSVHCGTLISCALEIYLLTYWSPIFLQLRHFFCDGNCVAYT